MGGRLVVSDTNDPHTFGQYLALTNCTECHGADLTGGNLNGKIVPTLGIVAAYSEADFAKLMRTGLAIGDRENNMSGVSRERFSHMNATEVKALHTYLSTLISPQDPISEANYKAQ